MSVAVYAIVATAAGDYYGVTATVGQIVNRVIWNGDTATWQPLAGTEVRADPAGTLQIGQTTTV